ncbi:MAG: hypothetical protein J6I61_10885 [Prevotella sp.]|nr:hypothetical protein [Prevotella sp.]
MKTKSFLLTGLLMASMGVMAQSDVTASVRSAGTATMSNGIVTIGISAKGKVTNLTYNGSSNLISTEGGGIYFSCNEPDYHEIGADKTELKVNTADMAEVVFTKQSPLGVKWSQGYILRKGESGVYMYITAEGNDNNAEVGEMRIVYRMNDSFYNYGYVTDKMQGNIPSRDEMLRSEQRQVQDATFKLDDGTIYTKYNWANFIKDDPFHGIMGSQYGAWTIPVSPEYINGGPMRQELTVHADTKSTLFLQMLHGGHFGAGAQAYPAGSKKIYGPFFLYLNSGDSHDAMIADAAAKAQELQGQWPFQWFDNDLYDRDRATVTGKIAVDDALQSATSYRVVLSKTAEPLNEGDGYIFWGETAADGSFSIPNVRKDTYVLTAYALDGGNCSQLTREGIVVNGSSTDLGTIQWTVDKFDQTLFRLGESDRLTDGFKLSDAPRAYENYQQVPASLTFTVGENDPANDWYYAQVKAGKWTVKFKAGDKSLGMMRLTGAAAGVANLGHLYIKLNGTQVGHWGDFYNDGSIYRSGNRAGRFQYRSVDFGASRLNANDWNTIDLQINSLSGTIGGIMWDCVKLELADDNVEYCDFVGYGNGVKPSFGSEVQCGDQTLQLISTGSEDFNNRIAVGPVARNSTDNCFKFRDASEVYYGLFSQYADRNLSVLDLHDGDRVTVEITKKDTETEALKFYGTPVVEGVSADDVVESGKTYTVSTSAASVSLDLVSTGSVYVKAIRIDKSSNTPTGIREVESAADKRSTGVYDLMGRRVTNPVKGHLYIMNGHKVLF